MASYIRLVNNNILPCNITQDSINFTFAILDNGKPKYISGQTVYIWGNCGISGVNMELGSATTNRLGVGTFTYPTNSIPDRALNTANFWASGVYQTNSLNSVKVRANFIYLPNDETFTITAGTCSKRFGFLVYNQDNRMYFDIIDGGCFDTVVPGREHPNFLYLDRGCFNG